MLSVAGKTVRHEKKKEVGKMGEEQRTENRVSKSPSA
jgi:hypothetical protein